MANSKQQRKMEKEEMRSTIWRSHRETLPPGPWTSVQSALHSVLNELQPRFGLEPPSRELRPPELVLSDRNHFWWTKAVAYLIGGIIENAIFISTKYAKPPFKCSHNPDGRSMCYESQECKRFRAMVQYVDWDHLNRVRTQMTSTTACLGIVRAIAISNSDGRCLLIDLLRIGGVPDAIKELLTDISVHKISFDLANDLPAIQATVVDFQAHFSRSYYDATFGHRAHLKGHVSKSSQVSWMSTSGVPSFPEVFTEWTLGRESWNGIERALDPVGCLSDILDVISGQCSMRGLACHHLDWFLHRPPDFYHNRAAHFRISILNDAIATSVVYISSLWLREDWRQGRNASAYILDWLSARVPPSLGAQPQPFCGQYSLGSRGKKNDRRDHEERRANHHHQ